MDQDRARTLLRAERDDVQGLLKGAETAGTEDRESEVDGAEGDISDAAQPLTAQGMDDAIAESLRSPAGHHRPGAAPAGRRHLRPVRPERRADS
jgi:hypothetical protein